MPFDDVKELNVDSDSSLDQNIDDLYHQMFDLSWFKGIEARHARTKTWKQYCDTLAKKKWKINHSQYWFGGTATKGTNKVVECDMLGKYAWMSCFLIF